MLKRILATAACGLMAVGGLTACGEEGKDAGSKKPKIGVILPDSKTSARWETADRKFLEEAFKKAGVDYVIQNAQDDKNAFQTIADQMITSGVTVLMIVNLDSGTGKAVLDKAKAQGVSTIDYDRLTLGGSAQYYVSFDNVAVGKLQGEGLVKCLTDKGVKNPTVAYLNGSPTDNNATLFKQGYDSVLKPRFDSGEYKKGPDQAVPGWDNKQGGVIFEQMLTQTGGKIDGVLAANDGLGGAAISVLKKNNIKIPVTGQDATAAGLQNILAGDQCMTVYKAVKQEAEAAAELALGLARGTPKQVSTTLKDPESGREVPSVLLKPQAIYFDSVKEVVADGYVTKAELCTAEFTAMCDKAGVK